MASSSRHRISARKRYRTLCTPTCRSALALATRRLLRKERWCRICASTLVLFPAPKSVNWPRPRGPLGWRLSPRPMAAELPRNRIGLAQWLLRPDHPLTARVTVNRFWQEVFGTGIVRTSGDFGTAGEMPSHPELLDWLAVEFRESGWDIKRFFKILVTSSTYRQAAVTTSEKREKDPSNRLLARGPRFRMDGEMIRDYALAASGLLVRKIGGPSVRPYQPEGVWEAVAMMGSDTRDYRSDKGDSLYRRSLYTF